MSGDKVMSDGGKYCINCKYNQKFRGIMDCWHPANGINVLYGFTKVVCCEINRRSDGICGEEGALFEEKEKLQSKQSLIKRWFFKEKNT
jgi:hypothetical protein